MKYVCMLRALLLFETEGTRSRIPLIWHPQDGTGVESSNVADCQTVPVVA